MKPSLKHVKQPKGSKVCGQACLAIVTGLTLAQAVSACRTVKRGRRKALGVGTTGEELRKTLQVLGRGLGSFVRPDWPSPGTVALARLRFARHDRYHWIVLTALYIYDPLLDGPVPLHVYDRWCRRNKARIVSWAVVTSQRLYAFR